MLRTTQYIQGVFTIDTMHYTIYWGGVLWILCTTQYLREVDTINAMHHAVSSEGGYYLCYALASIFGGWLLLIPCTTQCICGGWILLILSIKQYLRRVYTIYTTHTQYLRMVSTYDFIH